MTKAGSNEPKRAKRKVRLTRETVRDLNPTVATDDLTRTKKTAVTNDHRCGGATRGNCNKTTTCPG